MSDGFLELEKLAADLGRAGTTASRQARGVTAKYGDRIVSRAQSEARAKWNRSGRATGASATSIRARMSNSEETVGYVMVDGGGVYQETGAGHHPPNPVLGPAAEAELDWWGDKMLELGDLG
jgi:hypothetical protein